MGGFDPSKFVEREEPLPVVEEDDVFAPPPPAVATVATPAAVAEPAPATPETAESGDLWDTPPPPVATVAAVAPLRLDRPFAEELNAMFYLAPPYLKRSTWAKLCADARRFADEGKAEAALAAGWQPIELFGIAAKPWRRSFGVYTWGSAGLVASLRGRGVGAVEPHAIEIINRIGAHNRFFRGNAIMNPSQTALMWDAFHPSNAAPDDAYAGRLGQITDISKAPFGVPRKM